jgi:hypothetical protein
MTAIADRSQRVDGYLRRIIAGKLARIELRDELIESPGMNGFELVKCLSLCTLDDFLRKSKSIINIRIFHPPIVTE